MIGFPWRNCLTRSAVVCPPRARTRVLIVGALAIALCLAAPALSAPIADGPPIVPSASPPAATQPSGRRTMDEIMKDVSEAGTALAQDLPGLTVPPDPTRRVAVAVKALPDLRRMSALLTEMAAADPRTRGQVRVNREEITALMALFGDPQAIGTLKKNAVAADIEEAATSSAWLTLINWDKARNDPPAQEKLAEDFIKLAKAHPYSDVMAQVTKLMIDEASTRALSDRLETLVLETLSSPLARDLGGSITRARKLRALMNVPLTIQGTDPDGKPFSTAGWKGKVVLVQFWASSALPCVEQLARLKKLYADNHARGLEILGVTSDTDVTNFKAFLADNPNMPWPQLIDPTTPDVHPLVKQFGIDALPQLFLIDRRGIVRSVDAVKDLDTLLPKLLAQ